MPESGPSMADLRVFQVASVVLLAVVGVTTAGVAWLFGVPLALAILVLVGGAGALWWARTARLEQEEEGPGSGGRPRS